jgi:hypothetical protein
LPYTGASDAIAGDPHLEQLAPVHGLKRGTPGTAVLGHVYQ